MSMSIRWAINTGNWDPTDAELESLYTLIEKEEADRMRRYHMRRDTKLALGGRLMLSIRGEVNSEIKLGRTKLGRPYVMDDPKFPFNISHHADWVMMAYDDGVDKSIASIGVDVTVIALPHTHKTNETFFKTYKDLFTPDEWKWLHATSNTDFQLERFCWIWTMKEAFSKAYGEGIGFGLNRMCVRPQPDFVDGCVPSLYMTIDNVECCNWHCESGYLDSKHVYTVAYPVRPGCDSDRHCTRVEVVKVKDVVSLIRI